MEVTIYDGGNASNNFVTYGEITFKYQGDDYIVRVTARTPLVNPDDTMNCIIDFHNLTVGTTGRYDNVVLPAKIPADNGLRRHAALRAFNVIILEDTPIPSPVFP